MEDAQALASIFASILRAGAKSFCGEMECKREPLMVRQLSPLAAAPHCGPAPSLSLSEACTSS
eukprot:855790-Amphidinium_carterae.1